MKIILAIVVATTLALLAWGYYAPKTATVLILKDAVKLAEEKITLSGVKLIEKKNNKPIMELMADRSTIALDESVTNLEDFTLVSYSDKMDDITLTAEKGVMVNSTHDVTASGNVLVRDKSGRALATGTLRWINAERKMITDDFVWIFGDNFVINGRGMVAKPDEETFELLNDVRLTFQPRRKK